jgi:hypothetical protein
MNTRLVALVITIFVGSGGFVGCGRVAEHETEDTVVPDGKKHDGDANDANDASTEEDAAKAAVVTPGCDPNACPLRPSICVDDTTMRWYSGSCDDAGSCAYTPHDMTCDKAPIQPDCFQGGCRLVVLR